MERFHGIKRICALHGVKIAWPDKSEEELRKLEREMIKKQKLHEQVEEIIREEMRKRRNEGRELPPEDVR